jgi:vacuolar-type H+-ATPase subunit H
MEDHEVLRHLLDLEKEAAALVDDAQAEADRRISESEKQNRAMYDEIYSNELKTLESFYAEKIAAVNEDYRKQLEEYRENLKAVSPDLKSFSSLAEKFFRINVPVRDEP